MADARGNLNGLTYGVSRLSFVVVVVLFTLQPLSCVCFTKQLYQQYIWDTHFDENLTNYLDRLLKAHNLTLEAA